MRAVRRVLREIVLKHGWLKLLSLLLAYALWLTIRGNEGERVVPIPVTVQIPSDMQIAGPRPASVEVTVEGAFLPGNQSEMSYDIDLRGYGEGRHAIPLTPAGVRLSASSGFKVFQVSPPRVLLTLERLVAKDVPVSVPVQGAPAAGYDLYEINSVPKLVHVSGPRSKVDRIKELTTDPLSIAGRSISFQAILNLRAPDDDVQTVPEDAVHATIILGPHRETVVLHVPVKVPGHGEFVPEPAFLSVSVLAPVSYTRRLTAGDFTATVSVPEPMPAMRAFAVKAEVKPAGDSDAALKIIGVNPEEVSLLRQPRKK